MSEFPDTQEYVGLLVRLRRQAIKKSLRTVAKEAGLSPSYMTAVENGRERPTASTAARILFAVEAPGEMRRRCVLVWGKPAMEAFGAWYAILGKAIQDAASERPLIVEDEEGGE